MSTKPGNAAEKQGTETKSPPHGKKGDEILNVLKKSSDFVHDLMKENERLRYSLAKSQGNNETLKNLPEGSALKSELDDLRRRVKLLEDEKSEIIVKFKEVEKENLDFANKYIEIEHENNMLANLYIASYQLHSTLDLNEALTIIMEIIINLIGAEEFALYLLDEKTHLLKAVSSEGTEVEGLPTIKVGEGVVGEVAKSGKERFRESLTEGKPDNLQDPLVCIPMKINERVIGTIVIYKLLQQKESFSDLDYEMFSMLAGHTATAIFSSKLYTESERKLSTIQGFIDLLTKK